MKELRKTRQTRLISLFWLPAALALATTTDPAGAASVPQSIVHQGRLYDAGGVPVKETLSVTFAVYADEDGQTPLWTETSDITFDDGYFSVALGEQKPFDPALFDGSVRYLGITVGTDPEMKPRAPVKSVPYALLAGDVIGDIHPTTISIGDTLIIDDTGKWVGPLSGLQGPTGATGPAGADGAAGPAGPTGATGPQGLAGPQGPTGAMGPTGPAGAMGPAGSTGAMGPAGTTGAMGPAGSTGAMGPAGSTGAMGPLGPTGAMGPAGPTGAMGPAGTTGPMGPMGLDGPMGPMGPMGPTGPAGPAGSGVTLTTLANGDVTCPYGGTKFTAGATTAYACNGAPAPGGSVTYNGGIPPVTFAGYTTQTYGGNLNGRSGAHAICNAAFQGSHFCTNWEFDRSTPPPVAISAWVDTSSAGATTRLFRASYSTSDLNTCAGWTSDVANVKPDGLNIGRGMTVTPLGEFKTSLVGTNDGGCENARQVACCKGGTSIRFRGFTPATYTGNLSGRSGAHAICAAAFSGSHFCADWETEQASIPAPIPASGAWVDAGDVNTDDRSYRQSLSVTDLNTCAGWTTALATAKPDGLNTGRGRILTSLGGFSTSLVGTNDGGCENARPLACCDGYPPE